LQLFDRQSELPEQLSPILAAFEGSRQGVLDCPKAPTYAIKQSPQVFATLLHLSLFRVVQLGAAEQLTEFIEPSAAPATCITIVGFELESASAIEASTLDTSCRLGVEVSTTALA
jgi:hypothetical protein